MRLELIAFLCTAALFLVLGIMLVADQLKVDLRDGMLHSTAEPSRPPARAEPEPQTPAAPDPQADAAKNASRALNDVLKAASKNEWKRVGELLQLMGPSASVGSGKELPPSELALYGKKAIDAMNYDKAIEALTEAPQDAGALNFLAFALLRKGRLDEAHSQVTRSLALEPFSGATWANAAEILAERDNTVASRAALRVAIHLSKDRSRTLRFLENAGQTVQSEKFRAVIAQVLPQARNIPAARRPA